jgi:hypothetical protein
MKLIIERHGKLGWMTVKREEGDPRFYKDSTFLYHVQQELKRLGYDVIKKRMHKDGHMVDDDLQYIRTRSRRPDPHAFMVWWGYHAYRGPQDDFNRHGEVRLEMQFDIFT